MTAAAILLAALGIGIFIHEWLSEPDAGIPASEFGIGPCNLTLPGETVEPPVWFDEQLQAVPAYDPRKWDVEPFDVQEIVDLYMPCLFPVVYGIKETQTDSISDAFCWLETKPEP